MRKKIIIVLFVLIIFVFFITLFTYIHYYKVNKYEDNEEYIIDEKVEYVEFDDFNELGLKVAEKNGDWSKYNLSKEFRQKYNEIDGVFGKMTFDNVEYKPFNDGKYPFEDYSYLVVTQGLKKTAYIFTMVNNLDGYDIVFGDTIYLYDDNGKELDAKISINNNNYGEEFEMLSAGYEREQTIGITSKFHSKYPFFLDIFEHYSPLKYNHIKFIEEKSSWEKKEAYFEVDSVLECKKRNYLVEFALDGKGYLDDVVVHKVNEWEYEGSAENRVEKITYRNSNWLKLKLSDNFRKKYNSADGILKDIDDINVDIQMEGLIVEKFKKYIRKFTDKNGRTVFYIYEHFRDDAGNLDDIICEKLPYTNMSLEEVKELYLKEHSDK